MNPVSLLKIDANSEATVVSVKDNNKALYHKLLSMGIVNGTKIRLLSKSRFKGPVRIMTLGYQLSLRNNEADAILVNQK